jgi:histidinol-phosphate aminotransferase
MKLNDLIRNNIQKLTPYSSAREEYKGPEGVFLDANENPFGSTNRYPDPYQKELKKILGSIYNQEVDNLFIGNGSDEVIDLCYRIFCNPGRDKAISFSPTYGMYQVAAEINDVIYRKLPLLENFQVDIKALDQLLKTEQDIKLIFICSPNNPTGNTINPLDVEYILTNFNGIVIIDEAYAEFSESPSWSDKIKQYPNLIVTKTLSKAYGLAAARIGVAISNSKIIEVFNKVKAPYNISTFNQLEAIKLLNNNLQFEEWKKIILSEKKRIIKALASNKQIKKVYPSETNFLLLEVTDANFIYNYLINQKIIVRNRNSEIKNCIRVTIGTPEENQLLLSALDRIDELPN